MKCYNCKSEIDADSCFCDQCGEQVFVCPQCHTAGKGAGKRCGQCGTPLVAGGAAYGNTSSAGVSSNTSSAGASANTSNTTANQGNQASNQCYTAPGQSNQASNQGNPSSSQSQARPNPSQRPSRLVCRAEGVALVLFDGALIGRIEGPYASQLATLKYVSARHATLRAEGDHWVIADVGSRNGTAVNGQWCYSPLPFKTGDTVRIGNAYDFIAE